MAINLNLEKYGDQLKAFVNFAAANANDEDTLACIGGGGLLDPDGKPRTIVAKTDDDKIKRFRENLLFSRNADQARRNDAVRELFKETVFKVCGAKNFRELPPAVRDVMKESDFEANGGHPLSVRRILAVTGAIKAIANASFSVEGAGECFTMLKGVVDAKLAALSGNKTEKVVALKAEADRIARNRYNLYFASDMKDLQKGVESQFDKDHVRLVVDPKLKIGNEIVTFDSDTPLEEKHNIIAKFIRQDMNAKFTDLDDAERNKAFVVMSAIAQRFAISMQDGVTKSLSKGPTSEAPVKFGQPKRYSTSSPQTFSFGDDGSLNIHFVTVYDDPQLMLEDEHFSKLFMGFDQGSKVTITADVKFSADELNKIASTDYTKFDSSGPEAVMQRQRGEDEVGVAAMGQFRFGEGVKVSVSSKTVINGGELMVDTVY